MTSPTRFRCYIYEIARCKKDLSLSINLEDFDRSKLSLVANDENNFSILYDGRKFRLYVDKLYAKVKYSKTFKQHLKIKDDHTRAKERLMKVFSAIKELVRLNTEAHPDQIFYMNWDNIWLNCCEYDLTKRHSYHLLLTMLCVLRNRL